MEKCVVKGCKNLVLWHVYIKTKGETISLCNPHFKSLEEESIATEEPIEPDEPNDVDEDCDGVYYD